MAAFAEPLPIDAALPRLAETLRVRTAAVLVAPPGAGKTTRVPLVLADEPWASGRKIIVLEPRRLAARAAAERMAATRGEAVGETVGYRVRFASKVSARTRIEVVTEGLFARMILDDPMLAGVGAVLFDEFHERSLDADLSFALALDAQRGLREDLRLLVMSATIDGARIARLIEAPVIEAEGRAYPVETRYVGRDPRVRIETAVGDTVVRALRAETGSLLVFLPGAAEIRRTADLLRERVEPAVDVVPLYGALDSETQHRAIAPAPPGRRKVVLATSIAETSITIDGVRGVVDSGLARVPRYEADLGLTRLETVRVSRASADQRRGRAGRTAPGICWRLWEEAQTGSLEAYSPPEILSADLSGFLLALALWGVGDPALLSFLDSPPAAALAEARALLRELDAVDADGRITAQGRRLAQLPLPPRLARMVTAGASQGAGLLAADIAVILTERGLGGTDVDLRHRLESFRRDRSRHAEEARRTARRWAALAQASADQVLGQDKRSAAEEKEEKTISAPEQAAEAAGTVLALAYPDRIARNRGAGGAFLLANGRGAALDPGSPLAREPTLAVAEVAGSAAQGRILLAAPISADEIEALFAAHIAEREEFAFDRGSGAVRGRKLRRLGALVLAERPLRVVPGEETARLLAEGIAASGLAALPWTPALTRWRDRVAFLRRQEGAEWPDLSDAALAASVREWLTPVLLGKTALAEITPEDLTQALESLLPWALRQRLDRAAPGRFTAPSGSQVPIDYGAEDGPKISLRVQDLFGLDRHPTAAGVPLLVELLSPAQRPVQVTRDLPGFWRGSYAAVKAEMKGRYPRHPWPDDPLSAPATRRAKPRAN